MTTEEKKLVPKYRLLGRSGLRVHPINLGAMTFGSKWESMMGSTSDEDILKIMKKYYEIGGNFIDTANVYQFGESEEKISWALKKLNINRDDMVIATKYTNIEATSRVPNNRGNQKKSMVQSVDASLKRLNTNYIDLLYVHFYDFTTDMKDLMRALDEIVRSGKVLHVAISDAPAFETAIGNTIADFYGWNPFCAYQGRYSLDNREAENELLPMCKKLDVGFIPWGTLGQGKLTGKRLRGENPTDVKRATVKMSDLDYDIQDAVMKIAKDLGRSGAQVALNWMLQKPEVPSALIGARTYDQFEDCVKALDFQLTKEQVDYLNKASEPSIKKIFPTTFIGDSYKTNPWLTFGGDKYEIE